MSNSYTLNGMTPIVVLNGRSGGNALFGPQTPTKYKEEIEKLFGKSSSILMRANMTVDAKMTASVELTNLSDTALANARLYAVVYEDLGTAHNHYLVRDITPVESFTLSGHTTTTFKLASEIADSPSHHMVVILKSTEGTILQSLFIK